MAYRIPKDEIPKFSGNASEDPQQRMEEIIINSKLIPKNETRNVRLALKIRLIKLGLEDAAKAWHEGLPMQTKQSFAATINAFQAKFINDEQMAINFSNLNRRTQKEDETAESYGYELLRLMKMAGPDLTEARKVVMFIDGLQPKLRKVLNRLQLKTMDEAIAAAKREETLNGQKLSKEQKRKAEAIETSKLDNFIDKIARIFDDKVRRVTADSHSQYQSPHYHCGNNTHSFNDNYSRNNFYQPKGNNYNRQGYERRNDNLHPSHRRRNGPSRNEKGELHLL